jgi:hypothetical protein
VLGGKGLFLIVPFEAGACTLEPCRVITLCGGGERGRRMRICMVPFEAGVCLQPCDCAVSGVESTNLVVTFVAVHKLIYEITLLQHPPCQIVYVFAFQLGSGQAKTVQPVTVCAFGIYILC